MPNNNSGDKNNGRTLRNIIVVCICVIIPVYLVCVNFRYLRVCYANFSGNHFSAGDSMYSSDAFKNDREVTAIGFYRAIKPKDSEQGDQKWCFIITNFFIEKSTLKKYNSDYLGQYISHRILYSPDPAHRQVSNFYAIEPDKRVCLLNTTFLTTPMPLAYQFADSLLYIIPKNVK